MRVELAKYLLSKQQTYKQIASILKVSPSYVFLLLTGKNYNKKAKPNIKIEQDKKILV